jgi:hypothetical protein
LRQLRKLENDSKNADADNCGPGANPRAGVELRVTRCGVCELSLWTRAGRVVLVVIVGEAGSGSPVRVQVLLPRAA